MANTKKISAVWATLETLYAIVIQDATGHRFNDADGTFSAAPADPYLALAEDGVAKGYYTAAESRQAWPDGKYAFVVYERLDISPDPALDMVIGVGELYIRGDVEVSLDDFVSVGRKMQTNKAVISGDGTTVTVYDDDGATPLHVFQVSSDKRTRTPQ